MTGLRGSLEERFRRFFTEGNPDECWEWTGGTDDKGYGTINEGGCGRPLKASRVAWVIKFGPIPDGLFVLHSCDNPPCVNWHHLFLGTPLDNTTDMINKGRGINYADRGMMGEKALAREFAKVPPREPLTSITALWKDYCWRYVTGRRGDPAIPYTAEANSLIQAIKRACDSRGKDGKLFFHQGRVWPVNRDAYAVALLARNNYLAISRAETFEALYEVCLRTGQTTKGIGIVTIYDVAARLGAFLDLEPEHLYFHAGVTEGLRAIGVDIPAGVDRVPRRDLPEFFHDKDLDLVESFLCGYRSMIERIVKERVWLRDFWSNVEVRKPNDCWLWKGKISKGRGYYYIPKEFLPPEEKTSSSRKNASRVAYISLHGSPGKLLVCHTCTDGNCMNYAHLYPGTHEDNMKDCSRDGKHRVGRLLSEDDVREIRRLYKTNTAIFVARQFGISEVTAKKVALRTSRGYVEEGVMKDKRKKNRKRRKH